ncbi:BNR repeat-containing protein [Streptomyces acidiscabies]|uniref:BNR repeat-containing protein n=1 Tax=Streptomyces acidiscabies TaxID=42234 RepID=A0AAP6B576_9ACTN|nr:BNR repeat-containing protein [Streptomyces acidiscabies]MBP5941511.1 Tat pathway signal sequence domain protein [Streptomyces sp. LBUM 1476]MBZ3912892.1 BNR repeat-containing protein [Streptomyces acidiscabies]MDX2958376.1 BNR repeat-containing protein [Streptomyces acidiscabies]MDX3018743.1 BNR repeat-containing protein [Streptomyces acidiscabies]MDX3790954.1 BNR repeat-containing protein [Streptomyces acidiscabies]
MKRRTVLTTAILAAVSTPGIAGTARAADPGPSVSLRQNTQLDAQAVFFVSYDGLVNNNSFQKNGLLTYKGYQYAVWYTAARNAVVARRALNASAWSTVTLSHQLKASDSHNVISMGVSKVDGRLHLNMDSHSDGFFYVKSVAGLMDNPGTTAWTSAAFGAVQTTLDGLAPTTQFTYPQFIATPEGKLQLSYRVAISGNGRNALAEYDSSSWTALGEWSSSTGTYTSEHGSSTARNMYLHGIDYDKNGRLHSFFTWREQNGAVMCSSGGITNHDTGYVYSDDRGRTWRNDAGTVVGTTGGSDKVAVTDSGLVVDALNPDHSLMNQESQTTDASGLPHAIISYVPGRFGQCTTNYVTDRTANGRAFHLRKNSSGAWQKTEIPVPLNSSQRTKLLLDKYGNAYAIFPFGRIAAASKASGYTDWTVLYDGSGLNAFGEVVIDESRVAADNVLSFMYQEKSSGTTPSALHVVDFALPA